MRRVLHSFTVGVTPEGKEIPLLVGTIGEAQAAADRARVAGGVYDGVFYPCIFTVEGARETSSAEYAAPPEGFVPPEPRTSAVPAGAEAGASSERASAGMPSAAETEVENLPRVGSSSAAQPGTGELSQAAKPGLDDASPPAPETREQYIARLENADRAKLHAEAKAAGIAVLGITNAKVRELLVAAKFSTPTAEQ